MLFCVILVISFSFIGAWNEYQVRLMMYICIYTLIHKMFMYVNNINKNSATAGKAAQV